MPKFLTWRNGFFLMLLIVIALAVYASGILDKNVKPDATWGKFSGNPKTEWLADGRKMKLLEEFTYIDPQYKTWVAPKDWEIDGASIPQTFWSLVGPFEGPYRNASIVHDYGCDMRQQPWEDVHFMFYQAMRCSGVPEKKAKTMYAAVYLWGPRWVFETRVNQVVRIGPNGEKLFEAVPTIVTVPIKWSDDPPKDVRKKLEQYIDENDLSLEQIKNLDSKQFGFPPQQ